MTTRIKGFFLFILLGTSLASIAQEKIVLRATSKNAFITEGREEKRTWTLNPKTPLQEFTLTKSPKGTWIKFATDLDSIKRKLLPGQKLDAAILLDGKDACKIRINNPALVNFANSMPIERDTIHFELTAYNNLKFKTVLNQKDTLSLKFDSGTTGLLLTTDAIKTIAKSADVNNAENTLEIGKQRWNKLDVYPVELSGQGTDGRFGWDLFDGKVVEIDYDKGLFIVHSKRPKIPSGFKKLDIEYSHTIFCINGDLQIGDKKYPNRFLFDNGYQRTIMLDTVLMNEQNYPKNLKVIKKTIMHNGQGKEIPIFTVNNERLNLAGFSLFDIPVQLLATANPARFKTHILGGEVLKRFNTFLDFQKNKIYLKSNSLKSLPYTDAI